MAVPSSSSPSPRPTLTSPQSRTRRTSNGTQLPPRKPPHIAIECVSPSLDDARWAVKRILGDSLEVSADIFKDGHDIIAARLRYKPPGAADWQTAPMVFDYDSDRWTGGIGLDAIGSWTFTVDAWTDRFGTWRAQLEKKIDAGQDVSLDLLEGAQLVDTATHRVRFGDTRRELAQWASRLKYASAAWRERAREALDLKLLALMAQHLAPDDLTSYDRELRVWVDRERARFASWYEMFPRSQSGDPHRHGTFVDAERALARVAELGFDVVYLPPIHPVGVTNRKGRNNALTAAPDDPGSPWAIGGPAGGHTAIEPQLGTIDDFDRFVAAAHRLGMEIALDYALQCSPDHPWLREHPDWFFARPDGSLKHAENPPKKYEDIYPLDFWCADRDNLWMACRDILLFWISHGVHTFRVDNPHTKPFAFWHWLLGEIHARHPEIIFLSEAFTRPKRMKHLAKIGFTQSYTYFTWRTSARELQEYLEELMQRAPREYLRPNFFANTPDILHEYLQLGGRAAFRVRLLLAGTLSPLYGIYSGFELAENVPLRPGSEEYLHSEKYEIKARDFGAADSLDRDIGRLNRIRRENQALQLAANITFHRSENDRILFYHKTAGNLGPPNDLLIVVNLDPARPQDTMVHVPLEPLGLTDDDLYVVEDLITGARYTWRGSRNYVRLDPREEPGHVLLVRR
ncbi:MAG TPA: alpha-1,4-glucan--maltose-1-phosphate maltosyltransferase [Gemmatimonadaceae bacterium]|nr:alpha-1,4-glucan--maltose-1-phosphate maltosyltransferase [Gemmatimonadaceae bacterium]